jgi:hypothetical protein
VVLCGFVAGASAADSSRRTYANPVDVDYRYNFEQINERISYRTGADPVIVRHQDAYYLFMTLADGARPIYSTGASSRRVAGLWRASLRRRSSRMASAWC